MHILDDSFNEIRYLTLINTE